MLGLEVDATPQNVNIACENNAGATTALTEGDEYILQHQAGSAPIYLCQQAAAPTAAQVAAGIFTQTLFRGERIGHIPVAGEGLWAYTDPHTGGGKRLSVTPQSS